MSDQVLFDEEELLVTYNRVVSGDNTYYLRSITSVTTSKESGLSDVGYGFGQIILAFVFWLIATFVVLLLGRNSDAITGSAIIIVLLISLWWAAYGIKVIFTSRPYYRIHLNMADGKQVILTRQDAEYHQRALRAINNAIAAQG